MNPPGSGIFRRANPAEFVRPKRQILQTQGTGRFAREVTSEDELFAALGDVAASPKYDVTAGSLEDLFETPGREIRIVGMIELTQSIALDSRHSGLVLTATGNGLISSANIAFPTFTLNGCDGATFERLRVVQASVQPAWSVVGSCQGLVWRDIDVSGPLAIRTETGVSLNISHIENVRQTGGSPVTSGIDIEGSTNTIIGCYKLGIRLRDSGSGCRIIGNNCQDPLGAVAAIEVAAGHSGATIIGNTAAAPFVINITTNASGGLNTIVGNATRGGVITAAGTDAVAGNT